MAFDVPIGLQELLRLASASEAFLQELLETRELAAATAGVALTPSEGAILRAVPREQLRLMSSQMTSQGDDQGHPQGFAPVASQGIRPDQVPERPTHMPPSKGHRSGAAVVAAAALVAGAATIAECSGACDRLFGGEEPTSSESPDEE